MEKVCAYGVKAHLPKLFEWYLLIFLAFLLTPSISQACWGTRPLAMGGAFVAVSGDVHGVYWNPASLAFLQTDQFTWTSNLTHLDNFNYDDFFALALPFNEAKPIRRNTQPGGSAMGLAIVVDENNFLNKNNVIIGKRKDRHFNFSYGFCSPSNPSLSFGLSVKTFYTWRKHDTGFSESDEIFLLDGGLLYRMSPQWNFGLLVQNFNEPVIFGEKYVCNVRPGLAWAYSPTSMVSFELYDFFGNSEQGKGDGVARNIRFGFEHKLIPQLALRWGGYNINSQKDGAKAITVGFGWKIRRWELNFTSMDFYALSEDTFSYLAGLTLTF